MNYSETALPLTIQFGRVRWGLLHFTLSLGDESVETNFSDVYDPMFRLKHWLEAIAVGVEQCSFSYDPEGNDIRFNFRQVTYDRNEFSVAYSYSTKDDEPLLIGDVDRRQLVECFYRGFLDLDASRDFDRYQWEPEPYWHLIQTETGLDINSIIDEVIQLERLEVVLLDHRLSIERDNDFAPAPFYWDFPVGYDELPKDEKRTLLRKRLEMGSNQGQSGTKLAEIRSDLVESFLSATG